MAECCTTDNTTSQPCPACGHTGPIIGTAPVRAHRADATEGAWQHCATETCEVVFHLDGQTIGDDEVATRVGNKALVAAEPVCFCFGHTRDDLASDLAANGTSTIKASIKAAVADGVCACEHLNPDGSCCLAAVHRALKNIASTVPAT